MCEYCVAAPWQKSQEWIDIAKEIFSGKRVVGLCVAAKKGSLKWRENEYRNSGIYPKDRDAFCRPPTCSNSPHSLFRPTDNDNGCDYWWPIHGTKSKQGNELRVWAACFCAAMEEIGWK